MPPLISIVGKSKSGKTTLLERLVPELRKRGYRLVVIKHSAHGFDLDQKGKDSDRLLRAGGNAVVLVSPTQLAILCTSEQEVTLAQAPRWLGEGFDLLLAEGFSRQPATKIETHRPELGPDLLCDPSQLWAVVSDAPLGLTVPTFSWQDTKGLADLIVTTFPKTKEVQLELFVNGQPLSTNIFVNEIMSKTLAGMVSALKGVEGIRELDLRVRWGE